MKPYQLPWATTTRTLELNESGFTPDVNARTTPITLTLTTTTTTTTTTATTTTTTTTTTTATTLAESDRLSSYSLELYPA